MPPLPDLVARSTRALFVWACGGVLEVVWSETLPSHVGAFNSMSRQQLSAVRTFSADGWPYVLIEV